MPALKKEYISALKNPAKKNKKRKIDNNTIALSHLDFLILALFFVNLAVF